MQIRPTSSHRLTPVVVDTELEMAKLDRKRSQDRLHQRRHRAKRKQQLSTLEQDVRDLQASVAQLGQKRQRLASASSASSSTPSAKKSAVDHATQVVLEYFQMFKYGHSAIHQDAQEQFLQKIMKADVVGVDMCGVEAFAEQWRLSGSFFWSMLLEAKSMTTRSTGDLTIVEVDADVHLRFRADLATVLCPQLVHHEELLKTIVDNVICVGGKYTFIVEQDGQVSGLLVEVEFIDALCRVLGSLAKVSQVLDGAQIAMGSGKITCQVPVVSPSTQYYQPMTKKARNPSTLNYRLQVNYLLSSSSS